MPTGYRLIALVAALAALGTCCASSHADASRDQVSQAPAVRAPLPYPAHVWSALKGPSEHGLQFYLPDDADYDPSIPAPSSVLGFEIGARIVRHDQVIRYLQVLSEASDRVLLEEIGRTHQGRPLVLATVSAGGNIASLEAIRAARQAVRDGREAGGPIVLWMGYTVHGNEPSGSSAALLLAYHLAASRSDRTAEMLRDMVVLIDPCLNPDGYSRFVEWIDGSRSKQPVPDPNHREHVEPWPGGRSNHYWFDLNRDWLPATQPETRARLPHFHEWLPNVAADFHEMGHTTTYFFQPGIPTRVHPLIPQENQEVTGALARYHARALDGAGRLYFTRERFDDFYFGKGSTYPDILGSVGILYEQASSRGMVIDTEFGPLSFPTAVQNQLTLSLSTLDGSHALRDSLRRYQANFFRQSREEARRGRERGYLVGSGGDPHRMEMLLDLLLRHRIEVHPLAEAYAAGGVMYNPGDAFAVPLDQPYSLLVRAMFEERTTFPDSTFYDITSWTLPHALGLPFTRFDRLPRMGPRMDALPLRDPGLPDEGALGYILPWDSFGAARSLQRMLAAQLLVRVATRPFTAETPDGPRQLERGTLLVFMAVQTIPERQVHGVLRQSVIEDGVEVIALTTGLSHDGIDLGSPAMRAVSAVRPAVLVGRGMSSGEAGEIWHLLDQDIGVPVTLLEFPGLYRRARLADYTHIFLTNGRYLNWGDGDISRLRQWVRDGGVLVAQQQAAEWVTANNLHIAPDEARYSESGVYGSVETTRAAAADTAAWVRRPYEEFERDESARRTSGAICRIDLDLTHPLVYGLSLPWLPVLRSGSTVIEPGPGSYQTPGLYLEPILLSGYLHPQRRGEMTGSAAVNVTRAGRGTVIRFSDNPCFRGFFRGSSRLLVNALFFGQIIQPAVGEH